MYCVLVKYPLRLSCLSCTILKDMVVFTIWFPDNSQTSRLDHLLDCPRLHYMN